MLHQKAHWKLEISYHTDSIGGYSMHLVSPKTLWQSLTLLKSIEHCMKIVFDSTIFDGTCINQKRFNKWKSYAFILTLST